jgi:hypothetical protein
MRNALDFDGNGKADYIVYTPSTNTFSVKYNGASGSQSYQFTGLTFTARDSFTPGDYNGNGIAEFAIWLDSDRKWYNSGSIGSPTLWGLSRDEPVARDYDGDGKTDIAIARRVAGTPGYLSWWILRSSDSTAVNTYFGYDTDFPAPGRYDADNKFDIAIVRRGDLRNQSVHYALLSQSGGSQAVAFGLGGDLSVPGDYDGDGKTDIAVVRDGLVSPTNIVWYIYQSGSGSTRVEVFGLTGIDKPVQADYDGDGKTDPAVWRETTGTFYVLKSGPGGGVDTVAWGGYGDIPVAGYDTH